MAGAVVVVATVLAGVGGVLVAGVVVDGVTGAVVVLAVVVDDPRYCCRNGMRSRNAYAPPAQASSRIAAIASGSADPERAGVADGGGSTG